MLEIQPENWSSLVDQLICPACSNFSESNLILIGDKVQCTNIDCLQRYQNINGIPRLLTKAGDFMNEKDLEEYAPTYKNT
jgi:uncharacterized protein YbaR (Trm112 family)